MKLFSPSYGELVGSVGYGRYVGKNLILSFGISYDNNNAILFRPCIEWSFGRRDSKMKIHYMKMFGLNRSF